jgi:hypothetical protein
MRLRLFKSRAFRRAAKAEAKRNQPIVDEAEEEMDAELGGQRADWTG